MWIYKYSIIEFSSLHCRGWKFALSTLPARQNPSVRSFSLYGSRIIRWASLDIHVHVYITVRIDSHPGLPILSKLHDEKLITPHACARGKAIDSVCRPTKIAKARFRREDGKCDQIVGNSEQSSCFCFLMLHTHHECYCRAIMIHHAYQRHPCLDSAQSTTHAHTWSDQHAGYTDFEVHCQWALWSHREL